MELQQRLTALRPGADGDILLLLEHDPVVTLGRGADPAQLRLLPGEYARRGIALEEACRGGGATYHGPGQLLGYPIMDLERQNRDLHLYVRRLEEVLIRTLAALGIAGSRKEGFTGVWVQDAKIASIGIGVRNWISRHGFALNLRKNLEGFDTIVACGIEGGRAADVESLTGRPPTDQQVHALIIDAFAEVFSLEHAGAYENPA